MKAWDEANNSYLFKIYQSECRVVPNTAPFIITTLAAKATTSRAANLFQFQMGTIPSILQKLVDTPFNKLERVLLCKCNQNQYRTIIVINTSW